MKRAFQALPTVNSERPKYKCCNSPSRQEENHNIYYRAQKSKTKHKKKIAAAIYEYQADCDGEWGEISLNFEDSTAEIVRLADWDTVKTNKFAIRAIAYLLNCENEKLPKEMMVAFE